MLLQPRIAGSVEQRREVGGGRPFAHAQVEPERRVAVNDSLHHDCGDVRTRDQRSYETCGAMDWVRFVWGKDVWKGLVVGC